MVVEFLYPNVVSASGLRPLSIGNHLLPLMWMMCCLDDTDACDAVYFGCVYTSMGFEVHGEAWCGHCGVHGVVCIAVFRSPVGEAADCGVGGCHYMSFVARQL